MTTQANIQALEKKQLEVFGSKLSYLEQGSGAPMLFLHGVPTSSYLWRNIIPALENEARCIAPDLIGMGNSDKPDIEYTIFDHIKYIEAFIDQLDLKEITLVLHAWGSVIGFDIAMRRPELFKGIAFIESQIRPMVDSSMVSLPMHEINALVNNIEEGKHLVMDSTYYVDQILPAGVLRHLTDEEMQEYRRPFLKPGSCKPIWQFLLDLPKGCRQTPVLDLITNYSEKLQHSDIPKLMMFAVPGFNTTIDTVQWAEQHLPNLTLVDIDEGLHYPQESNPELIASELKQWYEDAVLGVE